MAVIGCCMLMWLWFCLARSMEEDCNPRTREHNCYCTEEWNDPETGTCSLCPDCLGDDCQWTLCPNYFRNKTANLTTITASPSPTDCSTVDENPLYKYLFFATLGVLVLFGIAATVWYCFIKSRRQERRQQNNTRQDNPDTELQPMNHVTDVDV